MVEKKNWDISFWAKKLDIYFYFCHTLGALCIIPHTYVTSNLDFRGLKYKSDNYQLCQACFWCGHIDSEHKNDVFKEYNSHKTSGSSGRSTTPSSLKKSINCLQGTNHQNGSGNSGGPLTSSKKISSNNGGMCFFSASFASTTRNSN